MYRLNSYIRYRTAYTYSVPSPMRVKSSSHRTWHAANTQTRAHAQHPLITSFAHRNAKRSHDSAQQLARTARASRAPPPPAPRRRRAQSIGRPACTCSGRHCSGAQRICSWQSTSTCGRWFRVSTKAPTSARSATATCAIRPTTSRTSTGGSTTECSACRCARSGRRWVR